jgi:hypothetical protein
MVLYGSNFGDANAHTCFNLPTLLAGGGFRHGQHLAFNRKGAINQRIEHAAAGVHEKLELRRHLGQRRQASVFNHDAQQVSRPIAQKALGHTSEQLEDLVILRFGVVRKFTQLRICRNGCKFVDLLGHGKRVMRANGLEKRTSRELELFVRLLEPLMLVVMAGLVLLVVAGLLLPIFRMSSVIE